MEVREEEEVGEEEVLLVYVCLAVNDVFDDDDGDFVIVAVRVAVADAEGVSEG